MRLWIPVFAMAAVLVLGACATGVAGSPRRICANAGYQPGTPEFTSCWHQVRDQMFAAEAPAIVLGVAAGVAANAPPPAAPAPLGTGPGPGTLSRDYVSGLNRICIYNTARGDYTVTVSSSQLCPLRSR